MPEKLFEKRKWSEVTNCNFEAAIHQSKKVIFIRFPFDRELIKDVKELKARWSWSNKAWYVPDRPVFRELFGMDPDVSVKRIFAQIDPVNQSEFTRFCETIQLKGYSVSTLKTYSVEFAQWLYVLKDSPAGQVTYEHLRAYIFHCIAQQKLSEAQIHSRINALKFYYEQVLRRPQFLIELPRPKKPLKLPRILSAEDVINMLSATENPKHLLMLQLAYGMGLRVSEVVKLKKEHIDLDRHQVLIAGAKGKKDRYVNLPKSVVPLITSYFAAFQPSMYLFEGQYGGQYSIRSVQSVFKTALKKAGIVKHVGIHALRHSYATHLLESGTDISFIKELLGHNNIKTTLIYAHVGQKNLSSVESPLDKLKRDK